MSSALTIIETKGVKEITISSEFSSNLIRIFEKAKQIKYFEIANLIFIYLLDNFDFLWGAEIWWETSDRFGMNLSKAYHDLCVIKFKENEICIPAPILAPDLMLILVKKAYARKRFYDRRMHLRETRTPKKGEIEDLWREFFSLICVDIEYLDTIIKKSFSSINTSPHRDKFSPRESVLKAIKKFSFCIN